VSDIWIAVGLDPVGEKLVLLGLADTEAESKAQQQRAGDDSPYRRSFRMTSDTFAKDVFGWLRWCKVPDGEAKNLLKMLAGRLVPPGGCDVTRIGMALERIRAAAAYEEPHPEPYWPGILRGGGALLAIAVYAVGKFAGAWE
jgi:hypothetical protein